MGGLISDGTGDSYTDPTGSTDPDPEEDQNYAPVTEDDPYFHVPDDDEDDTDTSTDASTEDDTDTSTEDDGVSHGVRDMDQDVADGADETTGEVSLPAAESGVVTDPNAQVEDTGYQYDGDLDDSPGGPAANESEEESAASGESGSFPVDVRAAALLALLAVAAIKGGAL